MRSRAGGSARRPEARSSPVGAGFREGGGRSGRPGSDACGTPLGEPPLATVRIRVTMNRLPSARAVVRLITPFLIAACQPQARRLLLLDLALSDPVVLNGTARPWADAGYEVQYRRFYPHLTRADLPQFRTLLFLLGREPEAASDALTAGDLALLDEWVRRGGVVVLGYDGDGEGYLDRWTANRWLAYEGAGISIGDRVLEDTTLRVVTTGRMQPWVVAQPVGDEPLGSAYDPFPLDRNHAVVTREPTQLLALTSHSAFVRASRSLAPRSDAGVAAAARIGEGLVVVMSRHALGTLGPQYRPSTTPFLATGPLADTYAFLRAVARWTRRPAEWAHVPPATPIPRGPTPCMPAGGSATPCGAPGAMPSAGLGPRASPGSLRSTMGGPGCRPPTPRAAPAAKRCRFPACSTRRCGSQGSLRPQRHSGGSRRTSGP